MKSHHWPFENNWSIHRSLRCHLKSMNPPYLVWPMRSRLHILLSKYFHVHLFTEWENMEKPKEQMWRPYWMWQASVKRQGPLRAKVKMTSPFTVSPFKGYSLGVVQFSVLWYLISVYYCTRTYCACHTWVYLLTSRHFLQVCSHSLM